MSKFKIGDRVKATIHRRNGIEVGETGVISGGMNDMHPLVTWDGKSGEYRHSAEFLELIEKSLETLEAGDVIFNHTHRRDVVLAGNGYVLTAQDGNHPLAWTVQELRNCSYKVELPQVEMTIAEIAAKLNIPADKLRIKE